MATTTNFITYPITIISFIITILTILSGAYLIVHFIKNTIRINGRSKSLRILTLNSLHLSRNSTQTAPKQASVIPHTNRHHKKTTKIRKHFKLSAALTVIFNALNTICNTLFCIYLIYDNNLNINYIQHTSHIVVQLALFCWYISKVCLLWFFSVRLYYAFKGSIFKLNQKFIIFVNILNTINAPLTFIINEWASYQNKIIIAQISFNFYCLIYQIIAFSILYMFTKRLLLLTIQQRTIPMVPTPSVTVNSAKAAPFNTFSARCVRSSSVDSTKDSSDCEPKLNGQSFIEITTRNAVLVCTISFMVALVTICFIVFYCVFGIQTRLTLSVPMIMTSVDCLITSICVICLFRIGDKLYYSLCHCCDYQFNKICVYFSRLLGAAVSAVGSDSASDLTIKTDIPVIIPDVNSSNNNVIKSHNNGLELQIINECNDIHMTMEKPNLKSLSSKSRSKTNKDYAVVLIDDKKDNAKVDKDNSNFYLNKLTLEASHAQSAPVQSIQHKHGNNVINNDNMCDSNVKRLRLKHAQSAHSNSLMFDHALYI